MQKFINVDHLNPVRIQDDGPEDCDDGEGGEGSVEMEATGSPQLPRERERDLEEGEARRQPQQDVADEEGMTTSRSTRTTKQQQQQQPQEVAVSGASRVEREGRGAAVAEQKQRAGKEQDEEAGPSKDCLKSAK